MPCVHFLCRLHAAAAAARADALQQQEHVPQSQLLPGPTARRGYAQDQGSGASQLFGSGHVASAFPSLPGTAADGNPSGGPSSQAPQSAGVSSTERHGSGRNWPRSPEYTFAAAGAAARAAASCSGLPSHHVASAGDPVRAAVRAQRARNAVALLASKHERAAQRAQQADAEAHRLAGEGWSGAAAAALRSAQKWRQRSVSLPLPNLLA